jgi:hypothetical protein
MANRLYLAEAAMVMPWWFKVKKYLLCLCGEVNDDKLVDHVGNPSFLYV